MAKTLGWLIALLYTVQARPRRAHAPHREDLAAPGGAAQLALPDRAHPLRAAALAALVLVPGPPGAAAPGPDARRPGLDVPARAGELPGAGGDAGSRHQPGLDRGPHGPARAIRSRCRPWCPENHTGWMFFGYFHSALGFSFTLLTLAAIVTGVWLWLRRGRRPAGGLPARLRRAGLRDAGRSPCTRSRPSSRPNPASPRVGTLLGRHGADLGPRRLAEGPSPAGRLRRRAGPARARRSPP